MIKNKRQKQQSCFSYNSFSNSRKAAMEMSVGTLVTIVLLMIVLVLGVVLIRSIFSSGTNAVQEIDKEVQNQINRLFTDDSKKLVIYPTSANIKITKGESGGVGISIRNTARGADGGGTFSYETNYVGDDCNMGMAQAEMLITLGRTEDDIRLESGQIMGNARLIKLRISETTPLCEIRYKITVDKDSVKYDDVTFDVNIIS